MKSLFTKTAIILFLLISGGLFAQEETNEQLIPNVTPPSPEVAALNKFGNYPVNYFTGLVNIEIPIYAVSAGEISVPITLKYHPSGIKVTDRAGLVGLGWVLQAGGMISRQVMGTADEAPGGYLLDETIRNSLNTSDEVDLMYLDDINRGRKDVEPDIYNYSFGSYSGKFLFNQTDNYSKVMIPYNPVRIDHNAAENQLTFEAYDPFGTNYKFNSYESSSNMNDPVAVRTAWKISQIVSKNKLDAVSFNYESISGTTYTDVSDIISVDDQVHNYPNTSTFTSNLGVTSNVVHSVYSTEQNLTEIVFPSGKVVFNLDDTRLDGYSGQKKLSSIDIYRINANSSGYILSKTIVFYQSYFESTNDKRLKLDSIAFKDINNVVVQKYRFDYNMDYDLPDFDSKERDYWGYFNNVNNNTLVPRMTIPWQSSVTTSPTEITIGSNFIDGREPNPTYMKSWILEKITYPTGGWTEFQYESNAYLDENSNLKYAGGLRVSQIISYDGINPSPLKKTIKYGENESGVGRPNFILNNYLYQSEVTFRFLHSCGQSIKRSRTFVASPSISIEPFDGSPVVYPKVTVYEGDETMNAGKTEYVYSDFVDNWNSSISIGVPAIESYHYKRGLLLNSKVYRNAGSSTYELVEETSNTYSAYPDSSKTAIGIKVKKRILSSYGGPDSFLGLADVCGDGDENSYQYNYYRIITGDSKLVNTSTRTYSPGGTSFIEKVVSYYYDNYKHQQVTGSITTTSEGESLEKIIEYPDENKLLDPVFAEMIQARQIAYPVKTITKLNSQTLQVLTKNYYKHFTNVFEPKTIFRQNGNGPDLLQVTFSKYDDKGNILEYVAKDGITQSVIWGYSGQYPIAQIVGASYFEIENALGGSVVLNQNGMNFSSTQIDQLKQSLPKAQISTFIFEPGQGLVQQSDPNSIATNYEYDDFGRLKMVRDNEANILKDVIYYYRNN